MSNFSMINGRVFIDGREVTGHGRDSEPTNSEPVFKTHVTMVDKRLRLNLSTAEVIVTGCNEPGIRVELEGDEKFVSSITFTEDGGTLAIVENAHQGGSYSNVVMSGAIVIGNVFRSVFGDVVTGPKGKVIVSVPEGIAIHVDNGGFSQTEVNARIEYLVANLSSQASVTVTDCRQRLSATLSGQSRLSVDTVSVSTLNVSTSGQSSLYYGGQADKIDVSCSGQSSVSLPGRVAEARLQASGQSNISAPNVRKVVSSHKSGMATIRA